MFYSCLDLGAFFAYIVTDMNEKLGQSGGWGVLYATGSIKLGVGGNNSETLKNTYLANNLTTSKWK